MVVQTLRPYQMQRGPLFMTAEPDALKLRDEILATMKKARDEWSRSIDRRPCEEAQADAVAALLSRLDAPGRDAVVEELAQWLHSRYGNDPLTEWKLLRCHQQDHWRAQASALLSRFSSTVARDEALDAARKCVPMNWLDNLLTGPDGMNGEYDCRTIEKLLRGIQDRISALKATPAPGKGEN